MKTSIDKISSMLVYFFANSFWAAVFAEVERKVEDAVNKLIEQRKESENGKHSSF